MLQLVLYKETTGAQTVKPTTKFNHIFFLLLYDTLLYGVVSLGN